MLERCYSEFYHVSNPCYVDCKVCDEWLNYSNFVEWYLKNYYEIDGETMQLDKNHSNYVITNYVNITYDKEAYSKDLNRFLNEISNHFSKSIDCLILVDKIKVINTKKGDKMSFITGSDETGTMDFTLFPKVYRMYEMIEYFIGKTTNTVSRSFATSTRSPWDAGTSTPP